MTWKRGGQPKLSAPSQGLSHGSYFVPMIPRLSPTPVFYFYQKMGDKAGSPTLCITTNSSPANRASTSSGPMAERRACGTSTSASSPALWPKGVVDLPETCDIHKQELKVPLAFPVAGLCPCLPFLKLHVQTAPVIEPGEVAIVS